MSDNFNTVIAWMEENLMKVQMTVFTSSNYILADQITDETGVSVTPAEVHKAAIALGYTPEQRHKSCFAYNAKFRVIPTSELLMDLDFEALPLRHKPTIMYAQLGPDGPIYVIITTNIRGRMSELEQLNPYNVHLRGVQFGAYLAYEQVVEALEPYQIKEGWYDPSPEVLRHIYQSGLVEPFWT